MEKDYLSLVNEVFNSGESINQDKIQSLIEGTMSLFRTMKDKIDSEDPREREAALKEVENLRASLQEKVGEICEKMGIDPSQLESLVTGAQASAESMRVVEKVNDQFDQLKGGEKPVDSPKFQFIR